MKKCILPWKGKKNVNETQTVTQTDPYIIYRDYMPVPEGKIRYYYEKTTYYLDENDYSDEPLNKLTYFGLSNKPVFRHITKLIDKIICVWNGRCNWAWLRFLKHFFYYHPKDFFDWRFRHYREYESYDQYLNYNVHVHWMTPILKRESGFNVNIWIDEIGNYRRLKYFYRKFVKFQLNENNEVDLLNLGIIRIGKKPKVLTKHNVSEKTMNELLYFIRENHQLLSDLAGQKKNADNIFIDIGDVYHVLEEWREKSMIEKYAPKIN